MWTFACSLLTQSLIMEYTKRFSPSVVYLVNPSANVGNFIECTSVSSSYFTATEDDVVLELVSDGFTRRVKFLVVVVAEPARWTSMSSKSFGSFLNKLGMSRWILEAKYRDHGTNLETLHEHTLACISIFVQKDKANVPADFVNCTKRRSLSLDSVSSVEHFPMDEPVLICLDECKLKNLADNVAHLLRALNASSHREIRHTPAIDEDFRHALFGLINTRRGHFSMVPVFRDFETFSNSIGTYPLISVEYKLLSRRRSADRIGSRGLVSVCDGPTWALMAAYALSQIFIEGITLNSVYDSSFYVIACFLGTSVRLEKLSKNKFNACFLLFGCSLLLRMFENTLLSALTTQMEGLLETSDDLEKAVYGGTATAACVSRREASRKWFDRGSSNKYFQVLGYLSSTQRVHRAQSIQSCIKYVMTNTDHVAIVGGFGSGGPRAFMYSSRERHEIHIAAPIVHSIRASFSLAPWLPFAEILEKFFYRLYESVTDFHRRDVIQAKILVPRNTQQFPEPFMIDDVKLFLIVCFTFALMSMLVAALEIICEKLSVARRLDRSAAPLTFFCSGETSRLKRVHMCFNKRLAERRHSVPNFRDSHYELQTRVCKSGSV